MFVLFFCFFVVVLYFVVAFVLFLLVATWARRNFAVIDFTPDKWRSISLWNPFYVWRSLQQSDVMSIIWKCMSPQMCVMVMCSVCPVFLRHQWCLDSLKKAVQYTYTPLIQRHNGIPCRSREPALAAGWSGCFSSFGASSGKAQIAERHDCHTTLADMRRDS